MIPIPDHTQDKIHHLNRTYFTLVHDLLQFTEPRLIEALFGLDATLCGWLAAASPQAIEQLATTPGLVYVPRLPKDPRPLLAAFGAETTRDVAKLHLLLHHVSDGEQPEVAGPTA